MTSTLPTPIQTIDELSNGFQGFITTGDKYLDDALGGGLCPGTITEFVGSSSTGKTQLALQLLLMVQLPRSEGGLGGSACYLTNTDALPTQRLVDIQANHPRLSTLSIEDAFARIETAAITTLTKLVRVLEAIPQVGARLADKLGSPLRLLVIDSIDVVFQDYVKTTDKTLFTRSKDLNEVALLLHRLASEHDLAILVINGVHSVFSSNRPSLEDSHGSIIYLDQARWFARGDSASPDGPVEAALGLVWANQIGTRVMLTRTGRRRKHVHKLVTPPSKRRLIASDNRHAFPTTSSSSPPPSLSSSSAKEPENLDSEETLSIRQFSVLFSQFAPPATLDYIITSAGVVSLDSQDP